MAPTTRHATHRYATILCVLISVTICDGVLAQKASSDWRRDPYTDDDPETLKKLGYVSYGPFSWDSNYGTDHIARTLGRERMLWVETAHFKLGCDLGRRLVPGETRVRKKITAELQRLKQRLPRIDPRNRKLDRWALLHLYAQRLEELYYTFSAQLGVTDADFPSRDGKRTPGRYMGKGPFLGQRGKFCVLLFDQRTQLARYLKAYPKVTTRPAVPRRHVLAGAGSLAFATASDCYAGRLYGELHMHNHLAGEVVKNLADGYKAKLGELPTWWLEGLGHWHRRRIDPRINLLDDLEDPEEIAHDAWQWDRRVRARVRHDYFPKTASLLVERSAAEWDLQLHMMSWSRVDFLIHRDSGGVRRFLDHLKDHPVPFTRVTKERALAWQEAALMKGFDLKAADFDAKWKEFVLASYPK